MFKFFSFALYNINIWFKISKICPQILRFSQISHSRGNTGNESSYFVNHPGRKNGALTDSAINIGEHSIPYSISAKYLGVIVDQELLWKDHVNHITTKLAFAARILSKLRHYVSKRTFVELCYSFAYPYRKYEITSWGSGSVTMLKQLQVLQNKIIRIMVF